MNRSPHWQPSGGHIFNKEKIRRNKMNDRQWCGNVRWLRSCPIHTVADHRVARPFRNRPSHGQPSGGHMFNQNIRIIHFISSKS